MKKSYILKKNFEIEKLFQKQKKANKYFVIYYANNNDIKICFSVAKKIGNAVIRNKCRRQLKEVLTLEINNIPNKRYLIIFRVAALSLTFEEIKTSLTKLLREI